MTRTVIRTWTRRSVIVSTLHPQYGELTRGRIEPATVADARARGGWRLVDQDYCDQGVTIGDYLDAEARLLEITAWADELDSDPLSFEEQSPAADPPAAAQQVEQEEHGERLDRNILGEVVPRLPRPRHRGQSGAAGAAADRPSPPPSPTGRAIVPAVPGQIRCSMITHLLDTYVSNIEEWSHRGRDHLPQREGARRDGRRAAHH
jgi:hypothetical protein